MPISRNRFHDGCWTCKAKRFQCDRTRPHCLTCRQKGFNCEGYEMRLKWGTGIASRGRFAGASEPVETAIPPRPKGRHRDIVRGERRRDQDRHREATYASTSSCDISALVYAATSESSPSSASDNSSPRLLLGGDTTWGQSQSQPGLGLGATPAEKSSPSPAGSSSIPCCISRRGKEEICLFQDFLDYGINTLCSTSVNDDDNILLKSLPHLWEQSEALCLACLTIQATLCPRPQVKERFYTLFNAALATFRTELGNSLKRLKDGTFTAGLMLSTIGLSRGHAWTMHLHGMYNVLVTRDLQKPMKGLGPYRRHLYEVMGYLDLPGFAIGRQNPSIGVWRLHCREPGYLCRPPQMDSVDFVSGLPRSLLDLLSAIDAPEIFEDDLWDWPGAPGSVSQCHLWESYRLSGILSLRNPQLYALPARDQSLSPFEDSSQRSTSSRKTTQVATDVIATRIIGHVDAITQAYSAPDDSKDSLLFNAIDYPLFLAGIEAEVMNEKPELKEGIKKCFAVREEAFRYPSRGTILLEIMEEWWLCDRSAITIHDLATSRGLELGLL